MSLYITPFMRTVVCWDCQICILPQELNGHLRDQHRVRTLNAIWQQSHKDFIKKYSLDMAIKHPNGLIQQLRHLKEPKAGWKCNLCGHCTCSATEERKHATNVHKANRQGVLMEAVMLQEMFHSNKKGGYIPVRQAALPPPQKPSECLPQIRIQHHESLDPTILNPGDLRTSHPFIFESGFGEWIGASTMSAIDKLREHLEPVPQSANLIQKMTRRMWGTFKCHNSVVRSILNSAEYVLGLIQQLRADLGF